MHTVGKLLLGVILAPFFACARYRLGELNQKSPSVPLATLGVNLVAAVSPFSRSAYYSSPHVIYLMIGWSW